jgi:PAS domain S-box-containing protein
VASRELIGDAAANGSQAHDLSLDLRHIFELSLDLMCTADAEGCLRAVSASAAKILGYQPEELIGRRFLELVHPDDVERTLRAHQSLIAGASVVEFENRYVRKDGAIVDLSWSASWSQVAGVSYSIARDITQRKRNEAQRESEREALQMSLVRLELAQSIARLGYWERDVTNDRMDAYGQAKAILGLSEDQVLDPATFMRQVLEEDRAHVIAGYSSINRGDNAPTSMQFRVKRADGSIGYVYAQRRIVRDASGKAIRVIGTLQDVTERHAADLERQRYSSQLAFLSDAARKVNSLLTLEELQQAITDIARELVDAHAAASHVSVNDRDSYAGSHSEEYLSLDAQQPLIEPPTGSAIAAAIVSAGRRIGTIRVANKREGGFTETDERILTQLADLAAVGLENARLYAELEDRVRRRTQELEQSNRELEAFSYSVSHDLRGPLRAIAGFTGLLRDRHYETIDAEGRRYLDRVLAGTQRMSSLIDNLLELGRVTRTEIKWEPVDLSSLAQSIANRLRETAPVRAATITIEPDRMVYGDLRLMEIALENLLDNAWKFTAPRPDAQIRFGAQPDRAGDTVFYVQDNGVGFDPRYAANLFGVFQRLHASSEFPGTGVGLATVQRIVQRHGGRIWAEAEAGRGATFYFTIARGGQGGR